MVVGRGCALKFLVPQENPLSKGGGFANHVTGGMEFTLLLIKNMKISIHHVGHTEALYRNLPSVWGMDSLACQPTTNFFPMYCFPVSSKKHGKHSCYGKRQKGGQSSRQKQGRSEDHSPVARIRFLINAKEGLAPVEQNMTPGQKKKEKRVPKTCCSGTHSMLQNRFFFAEPSSSPSFLIPFPVSPSKAMFKFNFFIIKFHTNMPKSCLFPSLFAPPPSPNLIT